MRPPASVLLALCVALAAAPAAGGADEVVRLPPGADALDTDGDGHADVLLRDRTAYHDLDGDGRFDCSLTFAFREYDTPGHARFVASGYAPELFSELTRAGLDKLCASERVAADWTAVHHREFLYYRDGYGRLGILDGSPENDGRLREPKARPGYELVASFNPDGTVASVRRGETTVELATFDFATNTASGRLLRLPLIAGPEDLDAVRSELQALFP